MLAPVDTIDADAGPRDGARQRERMCVVTREVRPIDELLRFVAGPDGAVVPDIKCKLPGRGVWVTADRATLAAAVKRNAFRRALRAEVKTPPDLAEGVEKLLAQSALDALSIAHKAGLVVTGFTRVEAAIASEDIAAIIQASDAAADGVGKIGAALKRRFGEGTHPPVIDVFPGAYLDLALGRPNVVHAALLAGQAGDAFLARWQKFERFRTSDRTKAAAARNTMPRNQDRND
jgi:predicted RNA-binding protein YlxR (DUF448 family)